MRRLKILNTNSYKNLSSDSEQSPMYVECDPKKMSTGE